MSTSSLSANNAYLCLTREGGSIKAEGVLDHFYTLDGSSTLRSDVPHIVWSWDGRQLSIRNDQYGLIPVFVHCSASRFIISRSIERLTRLGISGGPDWEALAVFLRIGWFLGDDTAFLNIKTVPPGTRYESVDLPLTLPSMTPPGGPSFLGSVSEARNTYADLFRQSMGQVDRSKKWCIPLSGGRDSRHIFLEAVSTQRVEALQALTIDTEAHLATGDMVSARSLSKAAGVSHIEFSPSSDVVKNEARKNEIVQFGALEHRWLLAAQVMQHGSSSIILEGLAGDTLSTAWGISKERLAMLRAGNTLALASTYIPNQTYVDSGLIVKRFSGFLDREVAIARVERELKKHLHCPNPLGSFHFWNRTRRVTGLAPTTIWNRLAPVHCPYLNSELFRFLTSLPAELMVSDAGYHQFHTQTIDESYPEFRDIAYADKASTRLTARGMNMRAVLGLLRIGFRRTPDDFRILNRRVLNYRLMWALVNPGYAKEAVTLVTLVTYLAQIEGLLRKCEESY